ncbi:TMP-TENI-domain-containing protein [Aaosphaeria arxii CBS 175.79]|uniref:TMP-TENI-domain-containing protein n=1 Tax=Aaosphaeria arxii CBS 175.79 TaxID=1450172 RepID=A0A6A5XQ55_9PLEO|nr:TMP-TENI-domain-containing protein [Aaosphaeria arxii CBS 175.79]KAF2015292.1 TMP-TENI-domain-containing protein [Aaosphaeria arxii CBS 175.79]
MAPAAVDYSLYLVTDSTPAILGDRDLVEVVEQALQGGVTIVQLREKTADTGELIKIGKALHEKCKQHGIPLLINDRVDVALAVGCEGVHVGQDDMNVATARQLLGPDKIIGATVSSIEEARIAVERGADYLGIGTLYATNTKKNTKDILGINGIRKILHYLGISEDEKTRNIKTVCIGGVNASNVQNVIYQLLAPSLSNPEPKSIDGVAVVSAIVGASDPSKASQNLHKLITSPPPFSSRTSSLNPPIWHDDNAAELDNIASTAITSLAAVRKHSPLSHNMTNLVVQNFAASVALAIGASPIMSNNGAEALDLANLGGGLVINMGTATPDALNNHRLAISAYNSVGGPIVLDPVGAGATSARRSALSFLLASGHFSLIKGNEREILSVARASGFTLSLPNEQQQKGVDSGDSLFTLEQKAYIVSRIAARERNIVLMTGATDVLSDGYRTCAIRNGHEYLGLITGSGCTLGTTLASYLAAAKKEGSDAFYAAVAGILHYEIAAERAASAPSVKGPGTFIPAFIDSLYHYGRDESEAPLSWLRSALKVDLFKSIPDAGLLQLP